MRHNNFGLESVFVTPDGMWKLSGMEFLCKQEDLTEEFLLKNRAYRNESIIPPEEKVIIDLTSQFIFAIRYLTKPGY